MAAYGSSGYGTAARVITSVTSAAVLVAGSLATETDTGLHGTSSIVHVGSLATETDTAYAGALTIKWAGQQATETDTPGDGDPAATVAGQQATELDVPRKGYPQGDNQVFLDELIQLYNGEETTAVLTHSCGASRLCAIENETSLNYTRVRNDFSAAELVVSLLGEDDEFCDECVGAVRTWCHELHILRGDSEVWSGPVTYVSSGRDDVQILARDNMAWLDRTPIKVELDVDEMDLVDIAAKVITDNITPDTGAGCLVIEKRATGVVPEDGYYRDVGEGYVGDVLRDLVNLGLNFTVLGRKLILFGVKPLADVGSLTEDDLLGDIRVVEDGATAVTEAVVVGNGAEGYASVNGVCGEVGLIVSNDTIETDEDAEALAKWYVASGYPTPLQIVMPPDTTLSPEANLRMSDLVPGVSVQVSIDWSCRPAFAEMVLTGMKVDVATTGETVSVSLETLESQPPAVTA